VVEDCGNCAGLAVVVENGGGTRVIYRWFPEREQILMLFVFLKQERNNLSALQLKQLRQVAESELK
jgi:hypothetical protein